MFLLSTASQTLLMYVLHFSSSTDQMFLRTVLGLLSLKFGYSLYKSSIPCSVCDARIFSRTHFFPKVNGNFSFFPPNKTDIWEETDTSA